VTLRFIRLTAPAFAIVMLLGKTAPAEPTRTARVIVAGSLAPVPLGVVELGLFANDWFYVHMDGAIAYDYAATGEEYAFVPGVGSGIDLMWGTKMLGYAGPCFVYLHNLDRGDFHLDESLRMVVVRVGFESPVSRDIAIRGWVTAGTAESKDATSGDGHEETLLYGSLDLGVAWRI
jgi:hypothetical protein